MKIGNKVIESKLVVVIISVIILLIATKLVYIKHKKSYQFQDNTYQAVFLTNGQVYFGHVERQKYEWINLTDIYYLKAKQQLQDQNKNAIDKTDMSLIKLGEELHEPEDLMIINKDNILFIENLKADSKIVKAIVESQK